MRWTATWRVSWPCGSNSSGPCRSKRLLFYGPPGHPIHYLASQLPNHTIPLVTAEQVGLIGEYLRLARFLQPAMMVIEDFDLIARQRTHMRVPGEEVLLNKLLNEMDGLQEDAEVLFILTTNRPDQIEPALAVRPGLRRSSDRVSASRRRRPSEAGQTVFPGARSLRRAD